MPSWLSTSQRKPTARWDRGTFHFDVRALRYIVYFSIWCHTTGASTAAVPSVDNYPTSCIFNTVFCTMSFLDPSVQVHYEAIMTMWNDSTSLFLFEVRHCLHFVT